MPHFGVYDPVAIGWPHTKVGVVPLVYHGVTFPQGVQLVALPLFVMLLDELVPRIPGGLTPGSCWGYTDKPLFHGSGVAIDVNATDNPIHRDGAHGPHTIPNDAGMIARKYGMEWGGDWTRPVDYMHFELHLSPAEVPNWIAQLRPHPVPPPPPPPPVRHPRHYLPHRFAYTPPAL